MGESYKQLVEEISGRLAGMDGRLEGIDRRITEEGAATRKEISDLRETVNEELSAHEQRIDRNERYVAVRSTIERGLIWAIGISVSGGGVVLALVKFVLS